MRVAGGCIQEGQEEVLGFGPEAAVLFWTPLPRPRDLKAGAPRNDRALERPLPRPLAEDLLEDCFDRHRLVRASMEPLTICGVVD